MQLLQDEKDYELDLKDERILKEDYAVHKHPKETEHCQTLLQPQQAAIIHLKASCNCYQ